VGNLCLGVVGRRRIDLKVRLLAFGVLTRLVERLWVLWSCG
jgi:hypothetical protein